MFGRHHNPQYARERLPLEGPRAGTPQGLRDAHLGRVLRGPFPTARCLPESEGCDGEGELPVLRGPRDDNATGGPSRTETAGNETDRVGRSVASPTNSPHSNGSARSESIGTGRS